MTKELKRKVLGYLIQFSDGKVMLFKDNNNFYNDVLKHNQGIGCTFPKDIGFKILEHNHMMTETIEAGEGWE